MKSRKPQHSVVLYDRHPIVLRGLRTVLAEQRLFPIAAETVSIQQLLEVVLEHQPGILIADLDVEDEMSLKVLQSLRNAAPSVRVVLFLAQSSGRVVMSAIKNYIAGLLFKECAASEIVACLEAVSSNRHYFTPMASDALAAQFAHIHAFSDQPRRLRHLTLMERRILALVAADQTTAQIGRMLFISPHTVSTHRKNIASKLGLRGTHGLIKFALEHKDDLLGWLESEVRLASPMSFQTPLDPRHELAKCAS